MPRHYRENYEARELVTYLHGEVVDALLRGGGGVDEAGRPPAPPRRRDGDRRPAPGPRLRVGRREAREGGGRRREPRDLRGGVEAGERRGRGGRGHDAGGVWLPRVGGRARGNRVGAVVGGRVVGV